jgi:nickel-dependent lactate racemase
VPPPLHQIAPRTGEVQSADVRELISRTCPVEDYRGRKILVIVPDGTRTAPVGLVFKALHAHLAGVARAFDVMIALGTHQPMSEAAICRRLEMSDDERRTVYGSVRFHNHAWDDPNALRRVGTIGAEEIEELSGGRFRMEVPVEVNRLLFEYDQIVIIGPVFPHEVVGFSGGNKYLFPGVAGPEVLHFFHWLGAVITNPMVIGRQWTPVRRVVDRAAALVTLPKLCFCMVVRGVRLAGLFAGTPEEAWDAACGLSEQLHIVYKERPFHTILSCAPAMYDELWTGGKCMYKLESVLADDGELIIYAPHITEVCVAHGTTLLQVGYHCRDYFLKQWDRFKHLPWGVLAHSTHVFGLGTYENGIETPRARVTLATGISRETALRINLGYRDPASIRVEDYADREADGILLARKAGETLYRLRPGVGV